MSRLLVNLLAITFSLSASAKTISAKEFYRLEECVNVIDLAGKSFWPEIVGFRGPWVYVTNEGQYLINYPKPFTNFKDVGLVPFKKSSFKPSRIQWRDKGQVTLNGEDHTSDLVFVFNSVSTIQKDLEYRNPIAYASSIEIVKKIVPLADTEDWMSLFLHEVFHQFQFSNTNIFDHYSSLKAKGLYLDSSELADIYSKNDWFKSSILEENRLLLKGRKEKNPELKRKLLANFVKLRKNRRNRYFKETGKNLVEAEAFWEMIEGGARYFEYATFRVLPSAKPNEQLAKVDSLYNLNRRYKDPISLEKMDDLDKDTKRTRYFYTTGFNLYMLLEEFRPQFHSELFSSSPMYTEKMLDL